MDDFLNAPFPAIRGQAPDLIPIVNIPEEEIIIIPQDGRLMHLRGLGLPAERVFQPVLQNPDAYLMPRYAPFEELPADWEAFSGNDYLGVQQHLQEELDAPEQVEDMDNEDEEFPENDDVGVQQYLPEELEAPEYVEDMVNEEEEFPENDDLGVQQHLPEELEAPEQVEVMDNEEEEIPENDDLGVQQHLPEELEAPEQVDAVSYASQPVAKRGVLTTNNRMLEDIGSSSRSVPTFGLQESAMPDASAAAFGSILEPITTSEGRTP